MTSHFLYVGAQHPFLILPLTIFAMLLILWLGKKRFPKASKLAILLPVWGVLNFIFGGGWNAEYVYNHGEIGEGVVVRLEPTNTWINEVQVVNYHCLIKTKKGETVETYFENSGEAFYPQTELWLPPQIGEKFAVKYIAGHEENFIVLTNDPKSGYSAKIGCTELLTELATAQATYQFDPSNKANKHKFEQLLDKFLKAPCDTNVQKAYRLQRELLKVGK